MADAANPTPPPAPTLPAPTPPAPTAPTSPPPVQKPPVGERDSLSLADVQKLLDERDAAFTTRLTEERQTWEKEAIPKIRESIEAPIRRQAKITALRQELDKAGKYLPADDDATDPSNPGDLAALGDLDDSTVIHTTKDGTKLTRLDVELNRVRTRLMKRDAKKSADLLGTPPIEPGTDNFYQKLREETEAKEKAARESRKRVGDRIFQTVR
jgi:hypothetical protein